MAADVEDRPDQFLDQWRSLLPAEDEAWLELGRDLADRHAAPIRKYHGQQHVLAVTDTLALLAGDIGAQPSLAQMLAAYFHDAVYDPTVGGGANEEASAQLAEHSLEPFIMSGQIHSVSAVAAVAMIRATAGHVHSPVEGAAAFLDADLAILGADPGTYQWYTQAIRKEYAHMEDQAFRAGRLAILRSFLERDELYFTAEGRARFDRQARVNVRAEIAELSAA